VVADPPKGILKTRTVRLTTRTIKTTADIDQIITQLQGLKSSLSEGEVINLDWQY
jgi:hypothetical protein